MGASDIPVPPSSEAHSSDSGLARLPGVFFSYLITRVDECRESVPGEDGDLNPIPNTAPCPAP